MSGPSYKDLTMTHNYLLKDNLRGKGKSPAMGFQPATSRLTGKCSNRCASTSIRVKLGSSFPGRGPDTGRGRHTHPVGLPEAEGLPKAAGHSEILVSGAGTGFETGFHNF